MRHIPNALTVLRLLAAPLLAWLIIRGQFSEALMLVLFAGLTDWLDGWTARRLGVGGKLGVILDPLADKTLLVTLFICLGIAGLVPFWLVLLVLGRDVVIVVGALLLRLFRHVRRFLPSMLGKISTFFQIVLVLLVLLEAAFPLRLLSWLEATGLLLSALFTALSGLDYILRGVQMAGRRALPSE